MISKFRYRKPAQNVASDVLTCSKSDKMTIVNYNDKVLTGPNGPNILDNNLQKGFKELFSQLQFSNESALPPDALRKALAESFSDQQRFQLGFMDDAAECFENILLRIHMHIAHGESQDMCNAQHCIPHQKFAMTLVEQTVCGSCGATSEPLSYTQMVHYVSTSTLVYQVRNGVTRASPYNHTSFGQLLRKAGNMGDIRMCPSQCGAVIHISRTLMNWPEIVSIGLVWNSERPSLEHIMEVFSTIGTSMLLGDVFTSVMEKKWTENCTHNLVGVVTYYGKHYSTFFFHTKLRVWIYFDDATVRQVGPHWEQVVEKCRKGRYQPLLLLYATPDGTPVNTENAPKQITQICSQKTSPKKLNPSQNFLRRSVTPSPEKPNVGSTRRAITPNPDCALNQKPPLPRPYNEYQNLSVIQNSLHSSTDVPDGYVSRKEPYVRKLDMDAINKPAINIHRTLSNGSSSGIEGMSDHMNFPRRRDSGNWSGDRNSASSASSTTMENPYLYLVGKVPQGNVPESPTLVKSDSSSAGSAIYDAGYDSYSLSSNDSSTMTTLQHMMKIGHLAKIPEDYNNISGQAAQSCDVLCDEADELLVKSRQLEDEHDLVLALALCNAAATKARAAMNAPYNNPQTLTLARMKHNTCIMRARSLHRRMTQTAPNKDSTPLEIRHTREGSSGSGRHSRQNSRDKGHHSRQNSKELLTNIPQTEKPIHKNIEIYATLPKRKDLKNRLESINIEEPVEYIQKEKQPVKETRSFFSRSKQKDNNKREKRSRSEDRSKRVVEFTLTPEIIEIKPKNQEKKNEKQDKEKDKDKDGKSKKQHKIRRKLLMGGLIKRKNRSMPDLTDANPEMEASAPQPQLSSVDDSKVGLKGNVDTTQSSMSGYLSEGHLEFSANNTNPNLKKSKLMRKSFYASAGKILSVPKVPPPPPLRTTSQLTTSKPRPSIDAIQSRQSEYQNLFELNNNTKYDTSIIEKLKLDQINRKSPNSSLNDSVNSSNSQPITLVTTADVHRESKGTNEPLGVSSVDEVDCFPSRAHLPNLELPPYPSPAGSTLHSRQASEEFPPPPPPLDLSALDEHLPKSTSHPTASNDSLLGQLQNKREQIFQFESNKYPSETSSITSSGDTWLKELQAKQAALKIKRINSFHKREDDGIDVVNTQKLFSADVNSRAASVKNLTNKFENKKPDVAISETSPKTVPNLHEDRNFTRNIPNLPLKKAEIEPIAPEQIAEEIREVERINATLQETLNSSKQNAIEERAKIKLGKKKSVSFCDQVILVATAEDQEDDSFIPNPILERVLRSAINRPELNEADLKSNQENSKLKEESEILQVNVQGENVEEHKTSSENLFDLTMRNTMENSKVTNPSPIIKPHILESQKVALPVHNQSPYQSVAFAHNKVPTPNSIAATNVSPTIHPQYPNSTQQQSHHYGYVRRESYGNPHHDSNSEHALPYSYGVSSNHSIQQQPIYSSHSNQNGYGHTNHPQPLNQQQLYNSPPLNQAHSGGHYQPRNNQQYIHPMYSHHQQAVNLPAQAIYSTSPQTSPYATQNPYSRTENGMRQSPNVLQPTYGGQPQRPNYQYPPQPIKSHNQLIRTGIYQSVPFSSRQNSNPVYQRVPPTEYNMNQSGATNNPYQHLPSRPQVIEHEQQKYNDPYQRVPSPHGERDGYQHIPPNLAYNHADVLNIKKSVSYEASSIERNDPSMPKAVVTPIIVNNANNSIPDKTKCNLCRKKIVASSNLYCADCEYYMSRFKPKT